MVANQEEIRKALREIKNLPTLPGIVIKLTKMAEDPDSTPEQIGRVISKDYILAAKLLKLVNSAFYGFPQSINSISNAIILLGFNVIKSLIISASIFEFMEKQDTELWEHSLGCAVVCNVLARHLGLDDPEEVSTVGLIHDIGKVAIKMELPAEYEAVSLMVKDKAMCRMYAERWVLGLDHAHVGGWLAKRWNLPENLWATIACHHKPEQAKRKNKIAAAVVHFSDIIIRGLGYGHGDDIWVPALDETAWQLLKLSPKDLDKIIGEVEDKLWEVKGFSMDIKQQGF